MVNAVVIPIRIAFNKKALAMVVPRKDNKGLNPINKLLEKNLVVIWINKMLTAGFEPAHANIPGPKPGSLDHSDKSTVCCFHL